METVTHVYADWHTDAGQTFPEPAPVGILTSQTVRNKELFRFAYGKAWLNAPYALPIDPALQLFTGEQFSETRNFRIFLDSCPDRWGRLLMKRREAAIARREQRRPHVLQEIDYLLGVHDQSRMGGLRFKRDPQGAFLDNNDQLAAPPLSSLRELEYAAKQLEANDNEDDPDYLKWLNMLISPGSSLGGARPKASVMDESRQLWLAKFPSRYDEHDIGAWEYVVYQLALQAGVQMAECRIQRFNSHHHTFLTKRFDRVGPERLHFTSAMTQLGYYDGDYEASYLELAEFIAAHGSQIDTDLEQLWRRIVFNIAVSNTDDHLRNHGFILDSQGWHLSPAYDINPITPAHGLHLNITDSENQLDFALALEVAEYFRLSAGRAGQILREVRESVAQWGQYAGLSGIGRQEQERMAAAFRY